MENQADTFFTRFHSATQIGDNHDTRPRYVQYMIHKVSECSRHNFSSSTQITNYELATVVSVAAVVIILLVMVAVVLASAVVARGADGGSVVVIYQPPSTVPSHRSLHI